MNSNKTICFKAIQETYRNSVVSYVRTRMKTAYPEDWQDRLRKLFQNSSEWAEIKRKMKEREVSHVVDIVTEDDFDMLSVNHFYNLFDREFNVLCPLTAVAGTDEVKRLKGAMLRYAQTVKELRNAFSHPTAPDFPYEDAFLLIDSARRFLACLELPEAKILQGLTGELSRRSRKPELLFKSLAVAAVLIFVLALTYHLVVSPNSQVVKEKAVPNQASIPITPSRSIPASSFGEGLRAAEPPQSLRASLPLSPRAKELYSEGWKKMRRLDFLGAKESFEKAKVEQPENALIHMAIAASWSGLGFERKAEPEAEEANKLMANLPAVDRLWVRGWGYEVRGEYGEAEKDYQSLWEQFPDNFEYGLRLVNAQVKAGKAKNAISTIEKLRTQSNAQADARVDLAQADTYDALSEFDHEIIAAQSAQSKGRATNDRQIVAEGRLREGDALWSLGRNQEAKLVFKDALRMLAESQDVVGENDAQMRLIDMAYEQGDELEVGRLYEELRASYESQGNQSGVASVLDRHAGVLTEQGEVQSAGRMYEEALRVERQIGDTASVASTLSDYGDLLEQLGDLAGASAKYQDSLTLSTQSGDQSMTAQALSDIAGLLLEQGELRRAQIKCGESLAIYKRIGNKPSYASTILLLGDILTEMGDLGGAKQKYERSLAIGRETHERITVAQSELGLAELSLEEGKPTTAEGPSRQAAQEFLVANAPVNEALAHDVLAQSLLAQDRLLEARKEIDQALSLSMKTHSLEKHLAAEITASRILAAFHNVDEATKGLQATLGEATKAGFVRYEFEARLSLGEIEGGSSATGKALLEALEKDARAKEFGLIARKAARASAHTEASSGLSGASNFRMAAAVSGRM
jgi:tetratricopeptide (TPR) repeat protein